VERVRSQTYAMFAPFGSRYEGREVVMEPGAPTYVQAARDLATIGEMPYFASPVGHGWRAQYQFAEKADLRMTSVGILQVEKAAGGQESWRAAEVTKVALVNGEEKVVQELTGAQLKAISPLGFHVTEFHLSPDEKRLLIAPEHHGGGGGAWNRDSFMRTYFQPCTVLEISTGRVLYTLEPKDQSMVQPAVLGNDGIYGVEEIVPEGPRPQGSRADHQIWLTRFDENGRHPVVQLPVMADKSFASAATEDGRWMVVHSYFPEEHLLVVPLKAAVAEGEIRRIGMAK
jgi:hypothetical protein